MNAVDTNILIYVNNPRDSVKQGIAASLVAALTEGVLLWQVACEYLAVSRKLESLGYNRVQAYQYVRDLQQVWYTALPTWSVIDRAEDLISRKRCLTLEIIRKLDRELRIPVDKCRPTLPTLIAALFYDLSTDKEIKIPSIGEKRERELRSPTART